MDQNQDNLQDIEEIEIPQEAAEQPEIKTFADLGVAPEIL